MMETTTMKQDSITFAQLGFGPTVTASSASPATDGYVTTFNNLPYHIHPVATPDAYSMLEAAIASGEVKVNPYVVPVVTLAEARSAKTAALYAACQTAITSGFASSALGSVHTYPSALTDQLNQSAVAQYAMGGLLYCEDSAGKWALVAHTQTQAQGVMAGFAIWVNACQSRLAALMSEVDAQRADVASVLGITWE
jgi:hypothetical protein